MSTFMGLETSRRGLNTQQSALYTTGHNISNANTLGYSRQRVNMEATSGFPGVGLNSGTMPGFLGTGVQAGSIERIRDGFVDKQYRDETNKLGYWDSKSNAVSQMEDVLAEPSTYGLQKSFSQFWGSLQDLATNPNESGTRAVVVRRGEAIADSFNHMFNSLTDIQTNLGNEIDVSTGNVNSMLKQIAELNRQISEVEPNGYMPNDLYDARDLLIDELAIYLPIETTYEKSGGRALAVAEGTVTITLKMKNGDPIQLVKGSSAATLETKPTALAGNKPIEGMTIKTSDGKEEKPSHADFLDFGKLKSLMNSYGTADAGGGNIKGLYPDMIAELNKMAVAFSAAFNEIHMDGTDLKGAKGQNFFVNKGDNLPGGITAGNIYINSEILGDPSKFAASDVKNDTGLPSDLDKIEEGNGKNAQRLADLQSKVIPGLEGATIETYFQGVIGRLGVEGEQATRNTLNSATLLGAVENRRSSISAVSLDEEMTDMIRFQQAYNASARMITVVDETLDKIINGMGIVGR